MNLTLNHTVVPVQNAILPSDKLVTAVVPEAFPLRLEDGRFVAVAAGTQELPEAVVNHWFAKAKGVMAYQPAPAAAPVAVEAAQEQPRRKGK